MDGFHPFRVLRARGLWIVNGVVTGVLALLFAVLYIGANVDPVGHLHKLPVGLVNADKGANVGGEHVNLGARTIESITKSNAGGDAIDWKCDGARQLASGARKLASVLLPVTLCTTARRSEPILVRSSVASPEGEDVT